MLAIYLAMLETEADQRRFTRFYEAYEKTVYAVALRVLGGPNRAEVCGHRRQELRPGHSAVRAKNRALSGGLGPPGPGGTPGRV